MKIRRSRLACLVLTAGVLLAGLQPVDVRAQAGAKPPAADLLNDGVLRSLGVEREWINNNDKLKTALREAMEAFQANNAQGTLDKLNAAKDADKSMPPGELLLARLLIAINNIAQGRQLLDRVASQHADTPEVYLLLGNLALGEGRLTDAFLQYSRAGELVGAQDDGRTSVVKDRWNDVRRGDFLREVYSGKAAVFEQLQNWDRAQTELIPWLAMNPEDPLVHFRKGRLYYLQGVASNDDKTFENSYTEAKKEFKDAYTMQKKAGVYKNDPAMERPEVMLLQLHTLANKLERSRDEIKLIEGDEAAIKSDDAKEASRIFTQISTWYLRQGEFEEARKYATKATELDKESDALKALSAMLGYYSNDPKAEDDFSKMHSNTPGDFFASNYLALILSESQDEAKKNRAVQLAELNARLYQQSAEALSTLGWCYFNAGRFQDALKVMGVFTQGAQISPDTAYYFAKVLFSVNRKATDDVFNLLNSAISAKGPFKHRREAETWMGHLTGTDLTPPKKPDDKPVPPPVVPAIPAATGAVTPPKP